MTFFYHEINIEHLSLALVHRHVGLSVMNEEKN